MIPTNVLQRTFRISYGNGSGTCFTIDYEGKQYLVTAKHIIADIKSSDSVNLFHDNQWEKLQCSLVGLGDGNIDIAVVAPSHQISPTHPLPTTTGELILGQDAYFLGFPYGLHTDLGEINSHWPAPLIKKACVSSIVFGTGKMDYLLLDGHNNPGFSGGPVVFFPPGRFDSFKVAGVISGFRFEWDSVFLEGQQTPLAYRYNTGIVVAFAINHAIDLIAANPIGPVAK